MKAAITPHYGPASILETRDVPAPTVGPHDVLVEIHATPVTAGDLRLRAADFPGATAVVGRLMFGLSKPRDAVQGTMFAGRVVEVGSAVTQFVQGDDVFGSVDHGAYAEFVTVKEDGPIAKMPDGVDYAEAADLPYGAWTALKFLRDLGEVKRGDSVLVLGASGGVGRYAVQLARHMGAVVTGVCSTRSVELVRELGADHVIDYTAEDFTQNGQRYDVIFDIADATTFSRCRNSLTDDGRYITLYMTFRVLLQMAVTSIGQGQKARTGVAMGNREDMEELRSLLADGVIHPVIADRFPLEQIAAAHTEAETGHPRGTVMLLPA